ncbi:MAG: ATP-binding protein, partial [Gammaproteobacteria bacterium]
ARIGIATGLVVVGETIGSEASLEQQVVGETPNLAARLQGLAEPGNVVIADATRQLAGELFTYRSLGEHELKGFSGSIQAWAVLGMRRVESRFAARVGGLSPLVGRDQEIGLIADRWNTAKACDGQVVYLTGEAGIGKSRIIEAFRVAIADELHETLLLQCSSYFSKSTLYPFIDQLERASGIDRTEDRAASFEKLETLLSAANLDLQSCIPPIANLLSLETSADYPGFSGDPARQKLRILNALAEFVCARAGDSPLLVIFEDVHWADPISLQLLSLLFESVQTKPILMLLTGRPDMQTHWGQHSQVTSLNLNRLAREQCRALVAEIAQGKGLPNDLMAQILSKTDGIPLFVEELTKTVLESPMVREGEHHYVMLSAGGEVQIPSTLQDSLMARLDQLAPEKDVAQIGAVLGREFSRDVLAAVIGMSDKRLDDALGRLVEAAILFRHDDARVPRYVFKHALVQDAAYNSLLRAKRLSWHARVANVIEGEFPHIVENEPERLAEHFTRASLIEQAVRYWQMAGARAFARSVHVEAMDHLSRALQLLESDAAIADRESRKLELLLLLGSCTSSTFPTMSQPSVQKTYEQAKELAAHLQDMPRLFSALRGLCDHTTAKADLFRARNLAHGLLQLAERESDRIYRLDANRTMGWILFLCGEFVAALKHLDLAYANYDPSLHSITNTRQPWDPGVMCLDTGARTLSCLGYLDQALKRAREGLRLANSHGHPASIAHAMSVVANTYWLRREHDETLRATAQLLEFCEEKGLPSWRPQAISTQGWVLVMRGDVSQGVAQVEEARQLNRNGGSPLFRPHFLMRYADVCLETDRPDDALEAIAEGLALSRDCGIGYQDSEFLRLKGEVLSRRHGIDEVERYEEYFRGAIEVARKQQARLLELRACTSFARTLAARGEHADARQLLEPIVNWFEEGRECADIRDALSVLAAQHNHA